MTQDATAPLVDPRTAALARLVATLAEDVTFSLACLGGDGHLETLGKRRGETYSALLAGRPVPSLVRGDEAYLVELTRAMAPLKAPASLPMCQVVDEHVTLEGGARGLRSLFSSKPSEKDVQRVRRLGALTVRVLRAIYAADGPLDAEEQATLARLVVAMGLPAEDATSLLAEAVHSVANLDVYGDIEPSVVEALVRGGWTAAASDGVDPREEEVVKTLAAKLGMTPQKLEELRAEGIAVTDRLRAVGVAAAEAVAYVLGDRMPGVGAAFSAAVARLVLPRRYRDEIVAHAAAGTRPQLAKRHKLASADRASVLGVAWAAALADDPTLARRALLRARHDRVAQDLGEDGVKPRQAVEGFFVDVLAPAAFPMGDLS